MTKKHKSTFESPWWYRQVPRDFMSSPDVQLMTAEECGSFFFLLQWSWLSGENCSLPNDPERLAKLARVERVSEIVLNKFSLDKNGRLFNERLSQEWQERRTTRVLLQTPTETPTQTRAKPCKRTLLLQLLLKLFLPHPHPHPGAARLQKIVPKVWQSYWAAKTSNPQR